MSENDCEDQACVPTLVCVTCPPEFVDGEARGIPLHINGKFWRCQNCNASYGVQPHPSLRRSDGSGPAKAEGKTHG